MMSRHVLGVLGAGLVLGLGAAPVQAFHCPKLVQECQALVAKMEQRDGADMSKVAQAKQGCADAQALHEQGNHKASVIKAGESISLAGEAAK